MPCDMKAYGPQWPETRTRILKRAGNRCEKCHLPNYAVGFRDEEGKFFPNRGNIVCDASGQGRAPNGEPLTYAEAKEFCDQYNDHGTGKRQTDACGNHWIVIVLTIAHAPGAPLHCPDWQLSALCQACHNRQDATMRAKHARRTRTDRRAVGSLWETAHVNS